MPTGPSSSTWGHSPHSAFPPLWARALPLSGACRDGLGLQSHPPHAGWPTPYWVPSLGAHPYGAWSRGHWTLVWALLPILGHWQDGEASVKRRWPVTVPGGWGWDRVTWSQLQSEPGLLEAWLVQERWEAGGRGCLRALSMEPCWGTGTQVCLTARGCRCELSCWGRRPAGEKPWSPAVGRLQFKEGLRLGLAWGWWVQPEATPGTLPGITQAWTVTNHVFPLSTVQGQGSCSIE